MKLSRGLNSWKAWVMQGRWEELHHGNIQVYWGEVFLSLRWLFCSRRRITQAGSGSRESGQQFKLNEQGSKQTLGLSRHRYLTLYLCYNTPPPRSIPSSRMGMSEKGMCSPCKPILPRIHSVINRYARICRKV